MTELLPLAVFPQGSLSSSIVPVIWVGVLVVCFFNLRLGWVLSGLVVPGYLAALMLVKPWAAAVVLFEGAITYFLVWFISEYLSRWAQWCNFFGRDRFFALVLCSIAVRLVFDGWLLLEFGEWVTTQWRIAFDYRNNLHSFGLIIVSLVANQFWKTGFFKGVLPLAVTLALTYLIVRHGLMTLTNFNLSNINYLYEDIATSILATPKAYIILVSTAFLASRMNLRYGWDFNGILIPSLLALQWYQPIKILATLAESCMILWLSTLLLKTPWYSKITIEGARKLMLFFNVSFIYKIVIGYAILIGFPDEKVTDYFGFGYLLSTLIAIKIHEKDILARLTRATLETSLISVFFASLVGFGLTLLPINRWFAVTDDPPGKTSAQSAPDSQPSLTGLLRQEQVELYQNKLSDTVVPPNAQEISAFTYALELLRTYLQHPDAANLRQAAAYLEKAHYRLELTDNGRYLYLHEQTPLHGWGVYLFDTQAKSELAVEVPAALDEAGVFDAGVGLFKAQGARSLAIAGHSQKQTRLKLSVSRQQDMQSFFQIFHRAVNPLNSLQLRGYDTAMARLLAGERLTGDSLSFSGLPSGLWVKERLPDGLNLAELKRLLGHFRINWQEPPFTNPQRQTSRYGFAELVLSPGDLRKLLFSPLAPSEKAVVQNLEQSLHIEGYLQEWLLASKPRIAPKGSQLYQIPTREELLFIDEQIITPLLTIIRNSSENSPDVDNELFIIAQAADYAGYRLIKYRDTLSGRYYLILAEREDRAPRYWGLYVFRLGESRSFAVQVPRPIYEINSFEYGVDLFERLKAQALMIATTHPYANIDGSANVVDADNKFSLFNLVNQVLMREAGDAELMMVGCRAFSFRPDRPYPNADALLSSAEGVALDGQLQGLPEKLRETLENDGLNVGLIDGSEQTEGYETGNAQTHYLRATARKSFVNLWLSPTLRARYRQQAENPLQEAQFLAFDINTEEQTLSTYLPQLHGLNSSVSLDNGFRDLFEHYQEEQDIVRLQQLLGHADRLGYRLTRLLDRNSKQAFLIIKDASGRPIAIANLTGRLHETQYLAPKASLAQQVTDYIELRKTWLLGRPD